MKKILFIVFGLLLLILPYGDLKAAPAKKVRIYRIVLQARESLKPSRVLYQPLIEYLSKATGCRFEAVVSNRPQDFLPAIERAGADFSFQDGLSFLTIARTRKARILVRALSPDKKNGRRGLIVARRDSHIAFPEELRGKRVGVSSMQSVPGYLAQTALCHKVGVEPEMMHLILVSGGAGKLVEKLFNGKLDAAFIEEGAWLALRRHYPRIEVVQVVRTEPYPEGCFAAFRQVDVRLTGKVRKALLHLSLKTPRGKRILTSLGAGGFTAASFLDYEIIRKAADSVRLPY
ncbi:MAG: PhnD/SsuA/transferrin family substrate-binding protein [bacterium]